MAIIVTGAEIGGPPGRLFEQLFKYRIGLTACTAMLKVPTANELATGDPVRQERFPIEPIGDAQLHQCDRITRHAAGFLDEMQVIEGQIIRDEEVKFGSDERIESG